MVQMKFLTVFFLTLMLMGCGADEGKHKDIVKNLLSDPESAQFQRIKQSGKDKDVWCGEVNAKNRLGGYVGYTRYVLQTIGFEELKASEVFVSRFVTERDSRAEFQSAWRLFCE
jgi:hypothetical protein